MKKVREQKKQGFLRKTVTGAVAGVLALTMSVGLISPATQSLAAETVADLDTTVMYTESLGNNASTEYAGRIWTDKSVWDTESVKVAAYPLEGTENNITVENDSDFLVSFSALATSQSITGQAQAPVDVVFIIDISGSMSNQDSNMDNGYSRIYNTVQALNTSIDKIMQMNPYTRVGVVGFNHEGYVFLPLDRYTVPQGSSGYFSLSRNTANSQYADLYVHAQNSDGTTIRATHDVEGGTNIQHGYYVGMSLLADQPAEDTKVTIEGKEVQRIPSVILLSDGAPTFSSTDNEWWAIDSTEYQGPGSSSYYGNGMKAMMTAAYMKQAIDTTYGLTDKNPSTTVYTVGMGITNLGDADRNLARITLNPGAFWDSDGNTYAQEIADAWEDYTATGNTSRDVLVNETWDWVWNWYSWVADRNKTDRNIGNNNYGEWIWSVTEQEMYTLTHPTNDISGDALKEYVDRHYDADDASSVTNVFADIVNSISISAPEVPTNHDPENPLTSGYITYTDPIGEYMEVKDFKSILYGGHEFTYDPGNTITNGNVTTYKFTQIAEGNEVYKEQSLENIIIEVETTTDAEGIKSQVLTIKVPAALIPIRVNTVTLNTDGTVKTHTNNNAYPIRVFYTVGLQNAVKSGDIVALEKISEEYLAANTNEDGTVNFYSNLYSGNKSPYDNDVTIGDATAVFDAASTNPFYYMQEDVVIHTNPACTDADRATEILDDPNVNYYYKETYYYGNEIRTTVVVRSGAKLRGNTALTQKADGFWYRPAGTVRANRMLEFEGAKEENNQTNTATDFYTPTYSSSTGHFTVYLGNNGLLKMKATGSLEITKEVTADTNLAAPDQSFSFTVELTDGENNALTGTYNYTVSNAEGEVRNGTITNGGTLALKDGEAAKIINLPPDAKYKVTETAVDGFTTTANGRAGNEVSGTITAGEVSENKFINSYSVESLTFPAEGGLSGKKVLEGRAWDPEVDSYTFSVSAYNNAPLPERTQVTVTSATNNEAAFDFGTIEFTEPGVYRYTIYEKEPGADDTIEGISYSRALYRVVITVVDNGDGTLSATADIQQLYTDDATPLFTYDANDNLVLNAGEEAQDEVVFTNKYSAESVTRVPVAVKSYTDHSGNNPLVSGMFKFELTPLGIVEDGSLKADTADVNPMPLDESGNKLESMITENEGINVTFPSITFNHSDIPEGQDSITFRYQMQEVIPDAAKAENNYTVDGMTYDPKIYTIDVTVSVNANSDVLNVSAVYTDGSRLAEFVNEYNETPVTLGEDTNAPISGSKVFTGRENNQWLDNDSFTFKLTPLTTDQTGVIAEGVNLSTKAAADAGVVVITEDEVTVTAADLINVAAGEAAFEFDKITFTKQGTFKFEVTEETGTLGGVTYDTHVCTVTVVVTDADKDSQLEAAVTYSDGSEAAFSNTYETEFDDETAISLTGTKTLEGKELTAGEFFFEVALEGSDETPALVPAGADGVITFLDQVTYTEAGDYTYIIKEQIPAEANNNQLDGITYDASVYKVTVTVTDDNGGNLIAEITSIAKSLDGTNFAAYDAANLAFANIYETTDAEIELYDVKKVLEGTRKDQDTEIPLQAGEFTFELSIVSPDTDNDLTKEEGVVVEKTEAQNDASGNVDFGKITFTKPGTYVLRVSEQTPEGATDNGDGTYTKDGITYSTNAIQSTFLVTDNGEGALVVTRTGSVGSREFKNVYETEGELEGSAKLNVTKNFVGREWGDAESFTFVLAGHDAVTRTAIENGTIVLPATDDATKAIVEASGTVTTGIENVAAITITKDMVDSVTGEDDAISTLADLAFGNITFKEAGTYQFHIREIAGDVPGIDYDGQARVLTVKAVDNGEGELSVTVESISGGSDDLTFTNTYEPDDVVLYGHGNLHVSKAITGREWTEDDSFKFAIVPNEEDADTKAALDAGNIEMQAPTEITIDSGNKDYIHFGNIVFKQAGKFEFIVTETIPADEDKAGGMTYDTTQKVVVAVVTYDDVEGAYSVAIDEGSDELTFVNEYNTTPGTLEGVANLKVSKVLEGREWTTNDAFKFTLTPVANDQTGIVEKTTDSEGNEVEVNISTADAVGKYITMPDSTELTISNADAYDAGAKAYTEAFGNITFTKPGTFTFEITETIPADEDKAGGMSYDTHKEIVVVTVTDNGTGGLDTEVTSTDKNYTFTNTYHAADVTAQIKGLKKMEGREFFETDAFEFMIRVHSDSPENTPLPENTRVHVTGDASAESWEIVFGEITYTEAGTYHYVVSEMATSIQGVEVDSTQWDVYVRVTDDGQGQLAAEVQMMSGSDSNSFEFVNEYTPAGVEAEIIGTKILNGRSLNADEFSFTITPDGNNPANDPITETTVKNAADGSAAFGPYTYDTNGTDAVYTYIVTEVKGSLGGVTYDDTTWTVTVEIDYNPATGAYETPVITYSAEASNATGFVFTNEYEPEEASLPGEIHLKVNKTFTGRKNDEWLATDAFTFTLTPADDDQTGVIVDETNLSTKAAVDAQYITMPATELTLTSSEGSFGSINFKEPGTYTFYITENDEDKGGITYDDHTMTVVVHVTDNQEGNLVVAAPTITDPDFTNTYAVEPTTATLSGAKVLTGRDLETDEFTFTISALTEDAPMPAQAEVKNAADETVTFAPITFTAAGVYRYEISEKNEGLPGVTYDPAKFEAIVTVADNHDGTLTSAVAYKKDGVDITGNFEFKNSYSATSVGVALEGTKTVLDESGAYVLNAGDFKFEIIPAETNPDSDPYAAAIVSNTVVEVNGVKTGKFAFTPNGQFTEADTYVYTIKEVAEGASGIVYDASVYEVTITVTDIGGKLQAVTAIKKDGTAVDGTMTFENRYVPDEVSTIISGKKVLEGKDLEGNDFEFVLEAANDLALKVLPQAKRVKNDQAGVFQFESMSFKEVGTYLFKVTEADGNLRGVTYDGSEYFVEVQVTGEEVKSEEVVPPTEEETVPPTEEGTVPPTEEGTVPPMEEETVPPTEEETVPPTEEETVPPMEEESVPPTEEESVPPTEEETVPPTEEETVPPVEEETVSPVEEEIVPLTEEKIVPLNTVSKVNPIQFLMTGTNGESSEPETGEVTENKTENSGKLYAKVTIKKNGADVTEIEFKNKYTPEEVKIGKDTQIPLKGTKTLTGRSLNAGEFKFEIIANDDSAPMPADNTAVNDANGNFEFGQITFTQTGTYYYTIIESSNGIAGIEYDEASYTVKVVVTDDGKGKLQAAVTLYNEEGKEAAVAFENKYSAAPASLSLTVAKELKGRALKDGEFEFEITSVTAGAPLPVTTRVKNNANGVAIFGEIKFTAAGDYTYKVKEIKGNLKGVTYDEAVYEVKVHVKDNLKGQLSVSLDPAFKGIKFVNIYEEPKTPEKPENPTPDDKQEPTPPPVPTQVLSPETGDLNNPILWIAVAVVAAAGGIFVRKRKK